MRNEIYRKMMDEIEMCWEQAISESQQVKKTHKVTSDYLRSLEN